MEILEYILHSSTRSGAARDYPLVDLTMVLSTSEFPSLRLKPGHPSIRKKALTDVKRLASTRPEGTVYDLERRPRVEVCEFYETSGVQPLTRVLFSCVSKTPWVMDRKGYEF